MGSENEAEREAWRGQFSRYVDLAMAVHGIGSDAELVTCSADTMKRVLFAAKWERDEVLAYMASRGIPLSESWTEGLSTRTVRALFGGDIRSWDQLTGSSAKELMRIDNFGKVSLNEIEGFLHIHGAALRDDSRPVPVVPVVRPECGTCRFYWPAVALGRGTCRIRAPKITGGNPLDAWPVVGDNWGCGEHRHA